MNTTKAVQDNLNGRTREELIKGAVDMGLLSSGDHADIMSVSDLKDALTEVMLDDLCHVAGFEPIDTVRVTESLARVADQANKCVEAFEDAATAVAAFAPYTFSGSGSHVERLLSLSRPQLIALAFQQGSWTYPQVRAMSRGDLFHCLVECPGVFTPIKA
jgi:hypothetical protein